jgi:hypothetical protein
MLRGMRQSIEDKFADMVVSQTVENVFAVAAACKQRLATEYAKSLGEGGDFNSGLGRKFANTEFAVPQSDEDCESVWISEGAKESRCGFEGRGVRGSRIARRMRMQAGAEIWAHCYNS